MAKAKTTKIGKTTVKGATDADKQAIEAGKAAARADANKGGAVNTQPADTGHTRLAQPGEDASKPVDSAKPAVAKGEDTPEAKRSASAKKDAAKKLFDKADDAALRGLPPGLTAEQRDNKVRRAALGF